jgi:hypothetical protein
MQLQRPDSHAALTPENGLIVKVSLPTQEFLAVSKETAPQKAENVGPTIQ